MYEENVAIIAYEPKKNQVVEFELVNDTLYSSLVGIGIKNLVIASDNMTILLKNNERRLYNSDAYLLNQLGEEEFSWKYVFNQKLLPEVLEKGLLTYNSVIAEEYNLDKNYAYDKNFKKRTLLKK